VNVLQLERSGAMEEAEQRYLQDLKQMQSKLGEYHRDLIPMLNHLSTLYLIWVNMI
jgi:hypothetical protein